MHAPITKERAIPAPLAEFDIERVAELYRALLIELGEDPDREGLRDTPRRAAAWWQEFLSPQNHAISTTFEQTTAYQQLVVVRRIDVWSLCEHHLLPFRLELAVGYMPRNHVLGLSKFTRIARHHAGRLQVQERLTDSVASDVARATGSDDVAVYAEGEHLCMAMRGIRAEQARTITLAATGRLDSDPALNARFMALAAGTVTARESGGES